MPRRPPRTRAPLFAAAALLGLSMQPASAAADSGLIERIVAVVGAEPILLSELRERAKPFMKIIQRRVTDGAQQAAAESEAYKEVLHRMIDEQLVAGAAARAGITCSPAEIELALQNTAATASVSVAELLTQTAAQGMTEEEYRQDLGRRLLEGKLLLEYARPRASYTDAELRARFDQSVLEERRALPYRASAIVLRIPEGEKQRAAPPEIVARQRALAAKIVLRARSGEDFAALQKELSRGKKPPKTPELVTPGLGRRSRAEEEALAKLEPGQISDPVEIGATILILKLEARADSRWKSFEQARGEMRDRLIFDHLDAVREPWLKSLRAAKYIEVEL